MYDFSAVSARIQQDRLEGVARYQQYRQGANDLAGQFANLHGVASTASTRPDPGELASTRQAIRDGAAQQAQGNQHITAAAAAQAQQVMALGPELSQSRQRDLHVDEEIASSPRARSLIDFLA